MKRNSNWILLTCLQGDNEATLQLYNQLMTRKQIYLTKASFQDRLFLRFVINSRLCEDKDVEFAWNEIINIVKEIRDPESDSVRNENGIGDIINEISEVEPSDQQIKPIITLKDIEQELDNLLFRKPNVLDSIMPNSLPVYT